SSSPATLSCLSLFALPSASRSLHSFPTRRSSDLFVIVVRTGSPVSPQYHTVPSSVSAPLAVSAATRESPTHGLGARVVPPERRMRPFTSMSPQHTREPSAIVAHDAPPTANSRLAFATPGAADGESSSPFRP